MKELEPSRVEKDFLDKIKNQDWVRLFTEGGCFYFALKLNEMFGFPIYYSGELKIGEGINHCWVEMKDEASGEDLTIDIKGIGDFKEKGSEVAAVDLKSYLTKRAETDPRSAISQSREKEIFEIVKKIINEDSKFREIRESRNSL